MKKNAKLPTSALLYAKAKPRVWAAKPLSAAVAICSILATLCVIALYNLPRAMAQYRLTVNQSVTVNVLRESKKAKEEIAIGWLYEHLFDTDTTLGRYWKDRLNDKSTVLDSTGGNFGVYVCEELKQALGLSETNFSFCITHDFSTKNGVRTDSFTVYFVNVYVGDLNPSDKVDGVCRFVTSTNEYTRGSIGLTAGLMYVKGVQTLINRLAPNTFAVTQ